MPQLVSRDPGALLLPQSSNRHHYIPCFYSSLWNDKTGMLRQYSRPFRQVKVERKSPKQVGFGKGLYDLPGLSVGLRSYLEDQFFKPVDCIAAEAMRVMLNNRTTSLPTHLRSGFARLLTSFYHRTPEGVERLKTNGMKLIEEIIAESRINPHSLYKPKTIGTFSVSEMEEAMRQDVLNRAWGVTLQNVTDSTMVNGAIINMGWTICELDHTRYSLLTSDNPLVKSNGFAQSEGNLSVALGPKRLFIATNNPETLKSIISVGPQRLVERFNHEVVKQARSYVFGSDDRQVRFVENRLRPRPKDAQPSRRTDLPP